MTNLSTTIDAFGDLKAEIADAELKLQAMKDALTELEKGSYEGERYRLNVIVADVSRTDWKKIGEHQQGMLERALEQEHGGKKIDWKAVALRLYPSPQLVTAYTTTSEQRSYRVGARTGKKVAA